MKFKKSILFSLIAFSAINISFSGLKAAADSKVESSMIESIVTWFKGTIENIDPTACKDYSDNIAKWIGYTAILFALEQGFEHCIHLYNERYKEQALKFENKINTSSFSKNNQGLSCQEEKDLKQSASEFSNPLYRWTIGWIKKNPIENWLDQQIQNKKYNQAYNLDSKIVKNLLIGGAY
jgi:hypothetical protein